MSRSRYSSPRLRYLKAKLSILTRPSFLVAVVFLSAVGLVIKEYWTNPDFLKFSQNQEASPSTSSNSQYLLSDEDRAIAADIDNLSVLDYDKKQANIPPTTSINDSNKVKKQNQAQLTNILDLAKKSQKENEIKPNTTKPQTTDTPSASQQNPFLKQAENLLQFKLDTSKQDSSANNFSPFSANSQTPQSSFNLDINNKNSVNPTQNGNSGSALQTAINQSTKDSQIQDKSAANNLTDNNTFGQLPQIVKNSSANQGLRQSQTNSLVNTNIFNQPLNNQAQNPYNNFNINQLPTTNYNQPGLNNQVQNPYGNFNNNQVPTNNYSQPGLNNRVQNPYSNFNNTQIPRNNSVQPNLYNNFNKNQQQNPYSNLNRNQLPNYNQQNSNNQVQNPYGNFNNNQTRVNGYSPQTQTRINNAYDKLINRDFPGAATRNNYTSPNNNINTGIVQPNVQQLNSPYSTQNPVQYPNNGYRY